MVKGNIVRGAVMLAMTTGLTLFPMESQEAVALAPIRSGHKLTSQADRWSGSLTLSKDGRVRLKLRKLDGVRRVRIKEHKLAVKRARLRAIRRKRMELIEKHCGGSISNRDRMILQRIVQAEAGDQDHMGKLLVACVILNRVCSGKFPGTISGVVFSPRQFSPIADGGYDRAVVSEDTKKAVDEALRGVDYSRGALYFMDRRYSDSSNISWFDRCLTRVMQHQGHEFYR